MATTMTAILTVMMTNEVPEVQMDRIRSIPFESVLETEETGLSFESVSVEERDRSLLVSIRLRGSETFLEQFPTPSLRASQVRPLFPGLVAARSRSRVLSADVRES